MVDWDKWLPGNLDATTLNRLRELERQAGALPILSALFFQEGIKQMATFLNIPIPNFVRMFLLAFAFGGAYIYHDKRYRAWQKAKEQAKKQKSKLDQSQSKMNDFIEKSNET